MATATVPASVPTRKCPKAFYATVDETHGVLTQIDTGAMYFLPDEGEEFLFTPEFATNTVTHGEVGLTQMARLADERHGGLAAIACSRYAGLFLESLYARRAN